MTISTRTHRWLLSVGPILGRAHQNRYPDSIDDNKSSRCDGLFVSSSVEKSERNRVSDDILKFTKGGKTQRANRKKIEFGCLVVPTNYRGSGDLFGASKRNLEFIRSVRFVENIAVLGYVDPQRED